MAVKVYLDASIIAAFFTSDVLANRAELFLGSGSRSVVVSDFAAAEFASAIARKVRTGAMVPEAARRGFTSFDTWAASVAERAETRAADVAAAVLMLRRLDLPLRTPDALNIAIAKRLGASLAPFDASMAASARALGMDVAPA